jgi:alginate O-acetyltransferase complex protein AlgI
MLFNSIQFLLFFPIVVLIYFIIPSRFRLLLLLIASCIFYAAAIPLYLLVIFLSILIDYVAAIVISKSSGHKRKIFLSISLIANLGLLAIFKYLNFFNQNLSSVTNLLGIEYSPFILSVVLPIGLSFHTFQGMSYVIEVYRKKFKPEKNILNYSLFVMFFPQLVAGPIERPQQLLSQFKAVHKFNYDDVRIGLLLMLWGMFKKVAIADRIALFVNPVFTAPQTYNGVTLAMAAVLFSFQIYYDFSGYTDIARGAARIFGYRLEINFNNPYSSHSIQDFWRRWHITLSSWFRDYVYISLGGNRKSPVRTYCNLLITFLLCGLWHGASWHFVIWGGLNGMYLIMYHLWNDSPFKKIFSIPPIIALLSTFFLVSFSWIFFRANTVSDAWLIVQKIVLNPLQFNVAELFPSILMQQNKWEFLIVVLLIIFTEFIHLKKDTVVHSFSLQPKALRWAAYSLLIWTIILAGKFGESSFIYFTF